MGVMKEVGMHGKEVVIEILRIIAKKHGMLFAHQSDFKLSVAQSMAVRDHVGTGTNDLARIKQAIELFCPKLKGILFPSNIQRHVSIMDRDGVVPSKKNQVCCTVNKKGNKRAMNTFYYCSLPSQLLENMISRMFMDNSFQKSFAFSSMSETILISVGFDKSDSDFVGTWRPCNRRNENSAVFVQTFACLEGPVSEDYANEMVTIGKPEYPIRYTIQSLVDDSMQALILSEMVGEEGGDDGQVKSCGCFIFISSLPTTPASKRCIGVTLVGSPVLASVAFASEDVIMIEEGSPDDQLPDDDMGLLPMIPLSTSHL